VSFSSTFNERLYDTKMFCAAFLSLQFGFVNFCQKNIAAKAAHKILVKSTPEVNFNNMLWLSTSISPTTLCSTLPVHST